MTARARSVIPLGLLAAIACSTAHAGGAVTCSVTNAPVLDFGQPAANPSARTDTAAAVNVSCSGDDTAANTAVDVCLLATRDAALTMRQGRSTLAYGLYVDSGRAQPLGRNASYVAARLRFGERPNVNAQTTLQLYGRIEAGQNGLAGGVHADAVQLQLRTQPQGGDCATGPVQAVTTLDVRAHLASGSCSVVASDLDFGTAHKLESPIDGSAALGVSCTVGTPYSVTLGGGMVGQDPLNRRMGRNGQSGPDTLAYQLYRDSARSQVWGGETHRVESTGSGSPRTHVVYGRLPAQPTPPAGAYRDTVTATVSY